MGGGEEPVFARFDGAPIEPAPVRAIAEPAGSDFERLCQNGDAFFNWLAGALLFGAPCTVEIFALICGDGGGCEQQEQGQNVSHGARVEGRRAIPQSLRVERSGG